MATFKKFEDIEASQKSRQLTKQIYRLSRTGEFARDFGLRDQIRRASVSIMSNIAEGYDRSAHWRIYSIPGYCERLSS
jgi:four helix bundle protein